jgi:tripartite-type tricarboxylate transporter receptor subunit TctC
MPGELVTRLNTLSLQVLKRSDVREGMANLRLEPRASTPQEYAEFTRAELDKMGRLVKAIGLKPE